LQEPVAHVTSYARKVTQTHWNFIDAKYFDNEMVFRRGLNGAGSGQVNQSPRR